MSENKNWYTDLKDSISNIFSSDSSIVKDINNSINDISATVTTIEKSIESSGLINSILSMSNDINEISNNITNVINSSDLTYKDKTTLLKLQQAINDGTLLKTLPLNADINDYQMITVNNSVFYIKKNKTKQYIIYGIVILLIVGVIISVKRGKK